MAAWECMAASLWPPRAPPTCPAAEAPPPLPPAAAQSGAHAAPHHPPATWEGGREGGRDRGRFSHNQGQQLCLSCLPQQLCRACSSGPAQTHAAPFSAHPRRPRRWRARPPRRCCCCWPGTGPCRRWRCAAGRPLWRGHAAGPGGSDPGSAARRTSVWGEGEAGVVMCLGRKAGDELSRM